MVASDPGCELRFNRTADVLEVFEVAIVQATTADELRHSLEGIEFGTVRGKEVQSKSRGRVGPATVGAGGSGEGGHCRR